MDAEAPRDVVNALQEERERLWGEAELVVVPPHESVVEECGDDRCGFLLGEPEECLELFWAECAASMDHADGELGDDGQCFFGADRTRDGKPLCGDGERHFGNRQAVQAFLSVRCDHLVPLRCWDPVG